MSEQNQRPFTGASFNEYLKERKLMASRCQFCQVSYLPPRAICPKCYSDQMGWSELSGRGELAAFTAVHIGPTFMSEQGYGRERPYYTGVVALEEGLQISARLVGFEDLDPARVKIGTPMIVEFLELGNGEDARVQLAFRAK